MTGVNGTTTAKNCIENCDLLIALGTRFSDHMLKSISSFAPNAKILHIDADAAEINKNVQAYFSITGDIFCVLKELLPHLAQKSENILVDFIKKRTPVPVEFSPQDIIYNVQKFARDAIFTTEVGQNQIWAAHSLSITRPRTFLTSGGLGTMGFGLGAAIGAAIGTGKTVVDISGDGSFYMNMNEIKTAVDYNLPVKIIILNNGVLGMVRQWQKAIYHARYSETKLSQKASFAQIAEAMGAHGYTANNTEELKNALKNAFDTEGVCVVDCRISENAMLLPNIK